MILLAQSVNDVFVCAFGCMGNTMLGRAVRTYSFFANGERVALKRFRQLVKVPSSESVGVLPYATGHTGRMKGDC